MSKMREEKKELRVDKHVGTPDGMPTTSMRTRGAALNDGHVERHEEYTYLIVGESRAVVESIVCQSDNRRGNAICHVCCV